MTHRGGMGKEWKIPNSQPLPARSPLFLLSQLTMAHSRPVVGGWVRADACKRILRVKREIHAERFAGRLKWEVEGRMQAAWVPTVAQVKATQPENINTR